jgi:hypothetical protein
MNCVLYSYRCPTRNLQNALLLLLCMAMMTLAGASLWHSPAWTTQVLLPVLFGLSAAAALAVLAAWLRATHNSLVVTETHVQWQTGLILRKRGVLRLGEVNTVYAQLHGWDSGRPDALTFATQAGEMIRIPGDCLQTSARPIVHLLREAHPHLVFVVDERH